MGEDLRFISELARSLLCHPSVTGRFGRLHAADWLPLAGLSVWPLLTCFVVEAYPIPKNSPVSATAQTTRNLYAAVGTSGYPESSADAMPNVPLDGMRGSP